MARYKGAGAGAGAASPWVNLSYDDRISESKPGSITGTMAMNADGVTWEARTLNSSSRHLGFSGWRIHYTLPSELFDGTHKGIEFEVDFDSDPTNSALWGVKVGLYNTSMGCGGGLEHNGVAGEYRAMTGLLGSTTKGTNVSATHAEGSAVFPGAWDGANTTVGATLCVIQTSTGKGSGAANVNSPNTYNKAITDLVVCVSHGQNSASGNNDFDFRCRYRLIEWSS